MVQQTRVQSQVKSYKRLKKWYFIIFTNPSARAGYDTRSICLTKAEEPSLPYYLPIAGGRIIGFIPFPRVLVLCEMQAVSSRIWTCVAMSISYDDNHYTMGTSKIVLYTSLLNTQHYKVGIKSKWSNPEKSNTPLT